MKRSRAFRHCLGGASVGARRTLVRGLSSLRHIDRLAGPRPTVYPPRVDISLQSGPMETDIAAKCLRCGWMVTETISRAHSLRSAVKRLRSLHPSCPKKVA